MFRLWQYNSLQTKELLNFDTWVDCTELYSLRMTKRLFQLTVQLWPPQWLEPPESKLRLVQDEQFYSVRGLDATSPTKDVQCQRVSTDRFHTRKRRICKGMSVFSLTARSYTHSVTASWYLTLLIVNGVNFNVCSGEQAVISNISINRRAPASFKIVVAAAWQDSAMSGLPSRSAHLNQLICQPARVNYSYVCRGKQTFNYFNSAMYDLHSKRVFLSQSINAGCVIPNKSPSLMDYSNIDTSTFLKHSKNKCVYYFQLLT